MHSRSTRGTRKKARGSSKRPRTARKPAAYAGPERRKPVLIVQHAPHEHPAAMLRALESQGILTQWIHPYLGQGYPEVDSISGIISLGGPMGANDEKLHPWIGTEKDLLRRCVDAELPTVGICLGAQILARALGGRVERHSSAEVGWFPVKLNEAGIKDPVVGAAGPSPTVYHWHLDTFYPPDEAVLLASSKACARQAYRIGDKVYGFQFHPEADHQLVLEWLAAEGIEDDIDEVRREHGSRTVQDSKTQRAHALRGEMGSLKITAAAASLFRKRAYRKAAGGLRARVERWLENATRLVVEFEGSDRRSMQVAGKILSFLSIPSGDYIILQGADRQITLWPIRLDDIHRIRPLR
jgi:GMP synthase (glutamine-hydrolysing)